MNIVPLFVAAFVGVLASAPPAWPQTFPSRTVHLVVSYAPGGTGAFFSGFPAAWAQVKAGTLKLIAVSTAKRSPAAADVPTVAEAASLPDFDIGLWQGVFAPRATPRDVVVRLNAEINRIITQPEITAKLRDDGADVTPLRVDQFSAFVKAESEKYLKIIKQSGVKPE